MRGTGWGYYALLLRFLVWQKIWYILHIFILPYFSTLSYKRYDFRKTFIEIKCVFWFSLQLLSQRFLILRRIQQLWLIMYIGLHVKYLLFLLDFDETWHLKWNLKLEPGCSLHFYRSLPVVHTLSKTSLRTKFACVEEGQFLRRNRTINLEYAV
jgi:hypothetical protein